MKVNWNLQRGGRVLEKISSMREVWVFSKTTQSTKDPWPISRTEFKDILVMVRKKFTFAY